MLQGLMEAAHTYKALGDLGDASECCEVLVREASSAATWEERRVGNNVELVLRA